MTLNNIASFRINTVPYMTLIHKYEHKMRFAYCIFVAALLHKHVPMHIQFMLSGLRRRAHKHKCDRTSSFPARHAVVQDSSAVKKAVI